MIALLGAILGLIGSVFPQVLKLIQDKNDHKHELEMYKLTMENQKFEHQFKLEEINAQADIAESQALYKAAESKITGIKWIDGLVELLNSSVRPVVTYLFFIFYGLAKLGQYRMIDAMPLNTLTTSEILWKLYTSEDMALFATVIAFWFGQRGMRYAMDRFGGNQMPRSMSFSSIGSNPNVNAGGVNVPGALKIPQGNETAGNN